MPAERANELARKLLRPFGIPAITPAALTVFRVLFGLGLLYILLAYQPIRAKALDVRNPHSPFADMEWVYALATNQVATSVLQFVGCTAAVFFTIGIFSKSAYLIVTTLMLVNVLMILTSAGGHDWGLPIVTLLLLIVVPWSDTPNVFELGRAWSKYARESLANRVYGFAVWLPGLTGGLAFAAAAYAKVGGTGLQWITNGSVRYHFVEDGRNAPITLGLWIATHPSISVAFSLVAVLVEAAFVFNIFARSWRGRLAFGLMGASLMAGFTLFQDVRWWPWRILFLAFLPWTLLAWDDAATPTAAPHDTDTASKSPRDLTWVHASIVVALIGTQLWASSRAVEIEPFVSNFPMYAYTWSSPQEFESHQSRMRFEAEGADISDRIDATQGAGILRRVATGKDDGESDPSTNAQELADFVTRYAQMFGRVPPDVEVFLVRRPFDWQRGRYLPQSRERVGVVHLVPR